MKFTLRRKLSEQDEQLKELYKEGMAVTRKLGPKSPFWAEFDGITTKMKRIIENYSGNRDFTRAFRNLELEAEGTLGYYGFNN